MKYDAVQFVTGKNKDYQRKRVWRRIFICMAVVVAFCTTYALIRPAMTLDNPTCGIEDENHTHDAIICYIDTSKDAETSAD